MLRLVALVALTTFSGAAIAQAPVPTDPISGGAGWVGAGLLGGVLAWLMFVRLPATDRALEKAMNTKDTQIKELADAKDNQIKELIRSNGEQMDRERKARHEIADKAQQITTQTAMQFEKAMADIKEQHRIDAEKDRASFMQRDSDRVGRLEDAIKIQTASLISAMGTSCRFQHPGKE